VLGRCWQEFGRRAVVLWMCVTVGLTMIGCSQPSSMQKEDSPIAIAKETKPQIEEVSPPEAIQQLGVELEQYDPQVKILGLEPDETVTDTTVNLRLQVKNFPIYQDAKLGLGPHLHVLLDDLPYETVYDVGKALTFKDLSPGTHTVRAFAVRPWDESFKSAGASDQLTFNILVATQANRPNAMEPLLTYNNPQGQYGTEPIMLDYSVTLPTQKTEQKTSIAPWSVNINLNGQNFKTSENAPIYLKGFKPGVNWLKLELLNANGKPVANAFSETVRLITLTPNGQDTLSRLVRGDLTAQDAERIVNRRLSKRLTDQENAVQEEQEALATEAETKRESVKSAAPAPEAAMKKSINAVEIVPSPVAPRSSPTQNASPSETISKPAAPRSLPSKAPIIQSSPAPVPSLEKQLLQPQLQKDAETVQSNTPEISIKQDVPLWLKLKSSLFPAKSDDAASKSQPNTARSIPSKTDSLKPGIPIQSVPQVSPSSVPLKTATPEARLRLNPIKMPEPSPQAGDQMGSSSSSAPPSVNDPKIDSELLEPLQKYLDFQPLDTEKLPVIQQETAVQVPSRYLKKTQTLNQAPERTTDLPKD
jgi:hypothetical protein